MSKHKESPFSASSREMLDKIMKAADDAKTARAADWPTVDIALDSLCDIVRRLEEMGWRRAEYAQNGRPLLLIEPGCTMVLHGRRDEVGFWVEQYGGLYPSHPLMFMNDPEPLEMP